MTPLILVTVIVILVATPLSVGAAAFCWQLYREDRAKPISQRIAELEEEIALLKRLPAGAKLDPNGAYLALAVTVTAAMVAGVLLAIPTVAFIAKVQLPFGGQLVLVAINILLPASVGVAGYLRLRR